MTNEEKIDMFRMRLEGKTLQEVGDKYGITRERARQITSMKDEPARDSKRSIYKKLGEYLTKNRITLKKFSEILEIGSTPTWQKLKGESQFKIKEIKKILQLTGMTFEECFATEEDKP